MLPGHTADYDRSSPSSPPPSEPGAASSPRKKQPLALARASPTLSEVLRRLGADGPSKAEIVKGPVAEGFLDPRTRWSGLGAYATSESEREEGREPGRRRRLGRKPAPDKGRSAATDTTAPENKGNRPGSGPGPGHTAAEDPVLTEQVRQDENQDLVGDGHRNPNTTATLTNKAQRDSLPPFSDGVPSRGLFAKTKGHYQYHVARVAPIARLPADKYTKMSDKDTKMSDKDTKTEHTEGGQGTAMTPALGGKEAAAAPQTRGQKIKRHCMKWWWLHLIIFICIVVLVVCLIIFVAVPKIAQARVDAARLTIQGIRLAQTQSTNFTLSINSTIEADDSIHAVLDPFDGVMYLEDWAPQTPFVRINFPQTTSAARTAVNITQFVDILDLDAFTVFNTWFLVNATTRVSVEGDTMVKVTGISKKYPVHFKQTVDLPSLSNFNGTTVPNSSVSLTPDANGDNFFGTVVIPNRSPVTFEIGNSSFINFMLDQNVGTVFIDNLVVFPGDNTYALRGNVSQTPVLQAIQQRPYCETGILPFQLQGLNVTNHGQYLSYYALSLASTNQTTTIDVRSDLQALGLTINCANNTKRGDEEDGEGDLVERAG